MHDRRELVLRLVQALGLAWIALAITFYAFPGLMLGRSISLIALPLALGLMVSWRVSIHWFLGHPEIGERILIVGSGKLAVEVAREVLSRPDAGYRIIGFEEKPAQPKSDLIPIGVYFLRPDAFAVIDHLLPSGRGELEITDVLNHYIPAGNLFSPVYGGHWTDAGTVPSLLRAAEMAAEDDAAGRLSPPVTRPVA